MSSVKNRILQFQNQQSPATHTINTSANNSSSAEFNQNHKNNFHQKLSTSNSSVSAVNMSNNHGTDGTNGNGNYDHDDVPPPKPPLNLPSKKTSSLNINLSGNMSSATNPSQAKPVAASPTKSAPSKPLMTKSSINTSAIPKLVSSPGNGSGPTFASSINGNEKLYRNIDFKIKFEESEKKRTHVVTLAQKATRDFEELRRRYQDVYLENEKLVQKLNNSDVQLDKLRKASEAAYDEYYKLKKRYQIENSAKSDALVRVDQYNKENRRLKRQSQVLMQQMNDSNFELDDIVETSAESPENDKEIIFLRNRVQELEARIVDLESELEKTKLAEFETQESVLLMNDSVQNSKSETSKLVQRIKQLEDEKSDLKSTVEELTFELDSIRTEDSFQAEKLRAAESELLKVTTEKKVLQRQSMVFMSSTKDSQLQDALNQISELQFSVEEQKLSYETQILELQDRLNEQISETETGKIEIDSKIRALEQQLEVMRERAEEAEKASDGFGNIPGVNLSPATPAPPPPPPPPAMFGNAPPPPPLPVGGPSLSATLKTVTLRRAAASGNSESSSGTTSPSGSSSLNTSPQIDDVISQLKKGIKLRPMDRTISRKQTEPLEKQGEETAVEEMRSILNNLKRTRRI